MPDARQFGVSKCLAGGPGHLDHLPGFLNGNRQIQVALENPDGKLWLSTPVCSLDCPVITVARIGERLEAPARGDSSSNFFEARS